MKARCSKRRIIGFTLTSYATVLLLLTGCSTGGQKSPRTRPGLAAARPAAPGEEAAHSTTPPATNSWRYAIVIDASSSGTGLQVFQWRERGPGRLPQIEAAPYPRSVEDETWEIKVRPGLSAYGDDPAAAARSLEPLVEYALDKIGGDANALAGATLMLRATAGMRLLGQNERQAIFDHVRGYLASLPLASTSARVISGREEGVYGWLAVNYILGHLEHGGPFPTVGALDLGGASTQITFVPIDYPREGDFELRIGGNTYHLYTHSYLGLGQDEARATVNSPACFLRDYPLADGAVGTGDFAGCRDAIRRAFEQPCSDEPCSLFGVYQPPLYGDFLAFSVYAYAADFFELDQRLTPATLTSAATAFCARDWNALTTADPDLLDNPFVPNYCYAAAHIVTLLTDGFGFPATTESITAPLRVQGSSVGWTLGALVHELTGEPGQSAFSRGGQPAVD